jgi:hypothetical protein
MRRGEGVEEELFFVEIGANDGKFADPLYAHVTTKVCACGVMSRLKPTRRP